MSSTIAFGTMGLTWRAEPIADEQAFETLRAAVKQGALDWSTADFYGPPSDPFANLKLLKRYFAAHPDDAKVVRIWVKSCIDVANHFATDTSREGVQRHFQKVKALLGDVKSVDYFGPARRDFDTSVEDTARALKELVDQGEVKGVFLSEVGAKTIEATQAIQPLSGVEVEFSLIVPDLLENGVARVAKQHDIPLFTYSPLGHGLLSDAVRSKADLPAGDVRHMQDRFQDGSLEHNLALMQGFLDYSRQIGATPAQVALAWILAKSDSAEAGKLIPVPGATTAKRVDENSKVVTLTDEQVKRIEELLPISKIAGGRAAKAVEGSLWA